MKWRTLLIAALGLSFATTAMLAQGNENFGAPPGGQGMHGGPGGMQPQGGPGGMKMSMQNDKPSVTGDAVYELSGKKSKTESALKLSAESANATAVRVKDGAKLTISDLQIGKTGNSSSEEESNFYSLNSAVAAWANSSLSIDKGKITTDASGSNAVFAWGEKAKVTVKNTEIVTKKNSSRGLDATYGGTIIGENLKITTTGAHCAALATDRGEGNVFVKNVNAETNGDGSPGIYSTGDIRAEDSNFVSNGAEAAVIEGKNSIKLKNTTLVGNRICGAMLYQSFSGDAGVGTSVFDMEGGSLTANSGPVFFITNTSAKINLKKAKLVSNDGVLVSAGVARWGRTGKNGGHLVLTADEQELNGDVRVNDISSISMILNKGTTLTGAINSKASAGKVTLALADGATWNVTGESSVDEFTGKSAKAVISRIKSNGNTIHYRSKSGIFKDGKSYDLDNGGKLVYTAAPAPKVDLSAKSAQSEGPGGMPGKPPQGGNGGFGGPGGPGGPGGFGPGGGNGMPPKPPAGDNNAPAGNNDKASNADDVGTATVATPMSAFLADIPAETDNKAPAGDKDKKAKHKDKKKKGDKQPAGADNKGPAGGNKAPAAAPTKGATPDHKAAPKKAASAGDKDNGYPLPPPPQGNKPEKGNPPQGGQPPAGNKAPQGDNKAPMQKKPASADNGGNPPPPTQPPAGNKAPQGDNPPPPPPPRGDNKPGNPPPSGDNKGPEPAPASDNNPDKSESVAATTVVNGIFLADIPAETEDNNAPTSDDNQPVKPKNKKGKKGKAPAGNKPAVGGNNPPAMNPKQAKSAEDSDNGGNPPPPTQPPAGNKPPQGDNPPPPPPPRGDNKPGNNPPPPPATNNNGDEDDDEDGGDNADNGGNPPPPTQPPAGNKP
ncbi:MAG: hypothetical protein LUD39_00175, partial [Opitutae bacterium]|nr:hypothetical protein [Opitutae bacterium]